MMVVLVSLEDPGLTIFPTHRVFSSKPPAQSMPWVRAPSRARGGSRRARRAIARAGGGRRLRAGETELAVDGAGELDVQLVDRLGHEGLSYTADWREAVRAVDEGEAAVAVLMRPTRIEDVFQVAARGETMPQKSTYFYPKLVSGLLFHPLEPVTNDQWLAFCRAAVEDLRGVFASMPTRVEREPVLGTGVGGDETTEVDGAAEDAIVAAPGAAARGGGAGVPPRLGGARRALVRRRRPPCASWSTRSTAR